jgi:hypothetical protein
MSPSTVVLIYKYMVVWRVGLGGLPLVLSETKLTSILRGSPLCKFLLPRSRHEGGFVKIVSVTIIDTYIQHKQRLSLCFSKKERQRLRRNHHQQSSQRSLDQYRLEIDAELILNTRPDVLPIPRTGLVARFQVETATVGPRRWDKAMVRVVHAKHGDQAVKCASWAHRVRTFLIHSHGKDIVVGRVISNEEDRLLRPVRDRVRQALVHVRTFAICSDLDALVELPEKFEGHFGDLEFAK